MIFALRRKASVYGAMAAMVPKIFLAYSLWFWVSLVLNAIAVTIYVFFWRAVYSNSTVIAGLDLRTTLNYILLAQVFLPLANMFLIFEFGYNLREGGIAHALLRPLDFQGSFFVVYFANLAADLVMQIPMALVATLVFGLQWPADPRAWAAFLVSAILGRAVLFFFDFILACFTFYTTEVWGLGVLVYGVSLFFSGSLVPLVMLPGWLRNLALSMPFSQSLYVPLSLLSGISPLASAPRIWLSQLAWLVGLWLLSRVVFRIAIRKITVQGG